ARWRDCWRRRRGSRRRTVVRAARTAIAPSGAWRDRRRRRAQSRRQNAPAATDSFAPERSATRPAARPRPRPGARICGGEFSLRYPPRCPGMRVRSQRQSTRSPNFVEVAVTTKAVLEAARTCDAVRDERFAPVVPFLNQRLAHAEPVALDGGASIGTHANLREACDLPCQLLRLRPRAPLGGDIFAQADAQALLRGHFPPGQDDLQRATVADDARQPHGSPVDQRDTPTAAVDAEVRPFRHHPEIAPQPQLHPAGDGRALDGRDDRLVQLEPRGPERSARNFAAIATPPRRRG